MEGKRWKEEQYVCVFGSELITIGLQHAQKVIAIIKCECEIVLLTPPKDLELVFFF